MDLNEISHNKIKYIIRNFLRIRQFFYRQKQNENHHGEIVEDAKSVEKTVVHLCFASRIQRLNKTRTRK